MTDAPIIARVDDIDKGFASRAFNGTSHDPERRGQSCREDYANSVNRFYAELWPLAETDDQKAVLATEMERYRQGYLSMMNAYLASHSSLASPMIVGPSNFPVSRMEKLNRWTDKKLDGLIEWNNRAREAVKRKLLDARPDEVKADHAWRALERDIKSSLDTIAAIDAGQAPYSRPLFVSSIAGKVERLAANGENELVGQALQLVRDYNASHKKPAISDRHKFWSLGERAESSAQRIEQARSSEPTTIARGDGVEVIADAADDRVRIVFAAKPDVQVIAKLKSEAWRWAPSEGAWQRKLTEAAKASARRITGCPVR